MAPASKSTKKPKKVCSVEGCSLFVSSRALCEKHYKRWRLYGDPLLTSKDLKPRSEPKLCRAPGCDRKAVSKGCCDKHYRQLLVNGGFGGHPKQETGCAIEGCRWPRARTGLCRHHYYRKTQYGDPLAGTPVPPYAKRLCQIEGCTEEAPIGTMCRKHAKAQSRKRASAAAKPCGVEGCTKPVFMNGYCQGHNKRFRAYGDPLGGRATPIKDRRCSVAGCDERAFAHGMCMPHFGQYRYHGDPLTRVNDPDRGCSVPGCEEQHRAAGFCASHHTMYVTGPKRRSKIRQAQGTCTGPQLLARIEYFGAKCWICRDPMEAVDHVKPVIAGGAMWPANLRPICRSCNSSKSGRWYGPAGLAAQAEKVLARKAKAPK